MEAAERCPGRGDRRGRRGAEERARPRAPPLRAPSPSHLCSPSGARQRREPAAAALGSGPPAPQGGGVARCRRPGRAPSRRAPASVGGGAAVASGRPPVDGRNPRPCSPPPATVGPAPVEESAPHRRHSFSLNRAEGSSRARSSLSARSSGATCKPRGVALARVSSRPGHRGCLMPSPSSSLNSSLSDMHQTAAPASGSRFPLLSLHFLPPRAKHNRQPALHPCQANRAYSIFLP